VRRPPRRWYAKDGRKRCSRCEGEKSVDEFQRRQVSKDGLSPVCKTCASLYKKEQRKRHPKKFALRHRNDHLKRTFGITQDVYEELLESQSGRCAICGSSNPGKHVRHFDVDHGHTTGVVRGLLCNNCNRGLGHFQESEIVLIAALAYIRRIK